MILRIHIDVQKVERFREFEKREQDEAWETAKNAALMAKPEY
jgi:hypothetical protein